MKRTILTTICALATALILVMPAVASDWRMFADIPFDFNVGNTRMASGKYMVEISDNGVVTVRSTENEKAVAISLSNSAITPRYLRNARLVFNGYAGDYFLSTLSWPDGPSRMLPPTPIEIKVAKNNGSRKVAVAGK